MKIQSAILKLVMHIDGAILTGVPQGCEQLGERSCYQGLTATGAQASQGKH
jgi:hypothetical protein